MTATVILLAGLVVLAGAIAAVAIIGLVELRRLSRRLAEHHDLAATALPQLIDLASDIAADVDRLERDSATIVAIAQQVDELLFTREPSAPPLHLRHRGEDAERTTEVRMVRPDNDR